MTPPKNRLLTALRPREFDRLTSRMTDVILGRKDLVYRAGGPIDHVYFPRTGMLSAVVVMAEGSTAEVAGIGREGMTGASVCLGATTSHEQVFCQIPPCECLHPNDERLAQWLFRCRDAVGAGEFNLTHEFMATML